MPTIFDDPESLRLQHESEGRMSWKRWGPYLSERQWGTVREDYSPGGRAWSYFPHEHARSRAYRFGEDGLLGFSDDRGLLCLGLALWNERDPILKERLFGLTGPEGNHGEDVKELYYYLESTPTHSYTRALYKYPQAEFPYQRLVEENAQRNRFEPEFELVDSGVFADNRYFDVEMVSAKAGADDICLRITVSNRASETARLHLLPQLWFRNTWSWGRQGRYYPDEPSIGLQDDESLLVEHVELGRHRLDYEQLDGDGRVRALFTDNETNSELLFSEPNQRAHTKDAFHRHIVDKADGVLRSDRQGTKVGLHYELEIPAGQSVSIRLRLSSDQLSQTGQGAALSGIDDIIDLRRREHDVFYRARLPKSLSEQEHQVAIQSHAGLLFTKQFYHYVVEDWLAGDPAQASAPAQRRWGRNREWGHLDNCHVISMPDKWEYPWYAAWDLAFHMVPMASIDLAFAQEQLLLFLSEDYMHPSGQMPAYEFALGDVNPPVHAWAVWRVYQEGIRQGQPDLDFLQRSFLKLLLNFTWWVNRKDEDGNNLFAGGFLGLDNIGVFDRSKPLPTGGHIEQADGTAWMAFFCSFMLQIALELAKTFSAYEDIAAKFFDHYLAIVDALNTLGGSGLWDEQDGFYYDILHVDHESIPIKIRSLVGLLPLCTAFIIDDEVVSRLPRFAARMRKKLEQREELAGRSLMEHRDFPSRGGRSLFSAANRTQLERIFGYLFSEGEFLSDFGIRSLSKYHETAPYSFWVGREEHRVSYLPGESDSWMFGGNSNWRGPVWFPMNYLLLEALGTYHAFYQNELHVQYPFGSGQQSTLAEVQRDLAQRLNQLFLPDAEGRRPCHGESSLYQTEPAFQNLVLFYEHFHGDDGRGLGASHQSGWTSLVTSCLEMAKQSR